MSIAITKSVLIAAAFALCFSSTEARAIDGVRWPTSAVVTRADPIAALRWPNGGWTCVLSRDFASARQAQAALTLLDRRIADHPRDARAFAARAVALRLLDRIEDAQRSLDQAKSLDATVVSDPDVALTDAFLLARAGQFERAVTVARRVLPRLSGSLDARIDASVEIARWSLRRGTEGLPEALAILREAAAVRAPDPALRATLAFALALAGRNDEAREVARSGPIPSSATARAPRGTLAQEILDASIGVALSFTDRAYDAVSLLERTSSAQGVPESFRTLIHDALRVARSAPRPPPPPAVRVRRSISDFDEQ
jgi:tetratricopeptide (TPR) repeat protein